MNPYDLFIEQSKEVFISFPKLRVEKKDDNVPILIGEIDIIDDTGKYWENYLIEIHCTPEFPNRFPLVYEVGGKLPRIGDWHINEDSKTCCICVLQEELLICKEGVSLLKFIQNQVLPYFFNQTHRRVEGYYVNGEYSHGILGIVEFYSRELRTQNPLEIIQLLNYIQQGKEPHRIDLCFCGSRKKYRKCHRESFRKLINLGQFRISADIEYIYKLVYSVNCKS